MKGKEQRQRRALQRLNDKMREGGLNADDTRKIRDEIRRLEVNLCIIENPKRFAVPPPAVKFRTPNSVAKLSDAIGEAMDKSPKNSAMDLINKKAEEAPIPHGFDEAVKNHAAGIRGTEVDLEEIESLSEEIMPEDVLGAEEIHTGQGVCKTEEYPDCNSCNGTGLKFPEIPDSKSCPDCGGTGKAIKEIGC